MNENGFLYIATGRRFLDEAIKSVASLRSKMPGVSTCCFTDDVDRASKYFDRIYEISEPYRNFFEKIPPLKLSPYENTIFVDTDTYFTNDMSDVFELLCRFEIAVVSDPFFCGPSGIPQCFSHLNTGLIAFKRSDRVKEFFDDWFRDYRNEYERSRDKKRCHDQMSFQRALYNSDLRLYILPPEYNLRMTCPQLVRIWAPVKMIHARHKDIKALGETLNSSGECRVIWPNWSHFTRSRMHFVSKRSNTLLSFFLGMLKWPLILYAKLKRAER